MPCLRQTYSYIHVPQAVVGEWRYLHFPEHMPVVMFIINVYVGFSLYFTFPLQLSLHAETYAPPSIVSQLYCTQNREWNYCTFRHMCTCRKSCDSLCRDGTEMLIKKTPKCSSYKPF